ncbi:DUF6346 domain-containing protein [Parenemella sanctibonifatiensis]|uniref:Uncharacterized protein n=1 Tax=Parenemella sanctibonifatiensis TaxID=2016505 RepID=A0A255DZL3_9ACTN|nr:DUF6346 domain-containing protein [Parenemella sanctibonifatiensis]OYN84724.1 hypothetical protein CGZ92_12965 [Parenemella sanctibonifatiensis]
MARPSKKTPSQPAWLTGTVLAVVVGLWVVGALLAVQVITALGGPGEGASTTRRGTATIISCESASFGLVQECQAEVTWEPETQWDEADLPTEPTITVWSKEPLSGEVAVTGYWATALGDENTPAIREGSEYVTPADDPVKDPPAGLTVGVVVGVIVVPLVIGWLLTLIYHRGRGSAAQGKSTSKK